MSKHRTDARKLRLGMALSIALGVHCNALAQVSTGSPVDGTQTSQEQAANQHHREVNLDLSSSEALLQARNSSPVNIQVGGTIENGVLTGAVTQTINQGQWITPAQFMAVREVIRGGQTLLLNDSGQAVGGYATISSNRIHNLSSIVVPQNVSLSAIGFNATSPLNVSGNINVLGSLFTVQNVANVASVFQVGNLNIGPGGLLSGNLPTGMNLGSSLFASAGLAITATNNITNMGTIATPGTLNLTAGGSILNQSITNTTAALMSAQNINLNTGIGQIVNSGLIQALTNINLNTLSPLTDLRIDSSKGVMEAIGAINVRDALASIAGNTTITGGNWFSRELNVQSGSGALEVSVENISGTMSLGANAAHVLANTPMLTLGNAIITGDPTYVNAGGDIQIVGTISENEALAIVAAGNITASGAARIINHGHDVWLIAGANIDTSSGACVGCGNSGALTVPAGTLSAISSGLVKVSATGAMGGNIDFATGNTLTAGNTVIDTTATPPGGAGGNVNLVALANGATGGRIAFPGSTITSIATSGMGSGSNGNVRLAAGAGSGQGITVGSITASGGNGAGASVSLNAAQASFSGGSGGCSACISFNATGTATGNISTLSAVNGGITITGPISAANGPTASISGGTITSLATITARNLTLVATDGSINVLTAVDNTLNATASGTTNSDVLITNTGDIANFVASTTGSNGVVALTNSGNVSLSGHISAPGAVTLALGSGKTLTNNGFQILSNNAVTLIVDSYGLTGANAINAKTGTVTIMPSTSTRAISLIGGAGLTMSSTSLSGITAGTLVLGSSNTTGGITLGGTADFSTRYNLQLRNGGDGGFEANGASLVPGSKSLVIDVGGNVNLAGIVTSGANLQIKGLSITLSKAIGSASDTMILTSTFGDILSSAVITAQSLTINANGYIGKSHSIVDWWFHVFVPMETAVTGTLNLYTDDHHMFGEIAVNNTGNLSSFSAISTSNVGNINFYNAGDVALGGPVYESASEGRINLTLSAASTLTLNGNKIEAPMVHISTDHLIVGAVSPGSYSMKGSLIQIWPTSPQGVINLGGGSGGLNLSNADLNSFLTATPCIGSLSNYGGIHVWSPINAQIALEQVDYRAPGFDHLNGGFFDPHGNPVNLHSIACSAGPITIAAGSNIHTIVGGTVTIEGPITTVAVWAFQGSITGSGVLTGATTLVALKGGITVETASSQLLLLSQGGDLNVTNTGNLIAFQASAQDGSVLLSNTGNIKLVESIFSQPVSDVQGVPNVGHFSVYGSKGVSIFQDAASTFTHDSQRILTDNSPINLVINSYQGTTGPSERGLLQAGTGTISITPSSSAATVSLFSDSGTIAINSNVFDDITAGKLILGSASTSGNISLPGPLNLSAKFSLQLVLGKGGSSFNANGNAITMGAKSLDLSVNGPVNVGSISTSSTIKLAGESVNIGAVNTSSGMTLVATAGSIIGSGKLSTSNLAYSVTGGVIDVNVNGTPLFVDSGGGTAGGFVVLGYLGYLPPSLAFAPDGDAFGTMSLLNAPGSTTSHSASPTRSPAQFELLAPTVALAVENSSTSDRTALNTIDVADANITASQVQSVHFVSHLPSPLGMNDSLASTQPATSDKPLQYRLTSNTRGSLALSPNNGHHRSTSGAVDTRKTIGIIFANPNAQLLTTSRPSEQLLRSSSPSGENLKLVSGSVFIDAAGSLSLEANGFTVQLQKGALVSIIAEDEYTAVRVCSGTGTVTASIEGKLISLNSGEELLVSPRQLDLQDFKTLDSSAIGRLGRRNVHRSRVGTKFVIVSEFSILNMIANHHSLRTLHKSFISADRQLLSRLLKVAASVDMVLKHRGAYLD